MPTLNWIGKAAVVNHHRQVPYHLLRCDRKLSAGDAGAGNLLVEGDNLLALKALLPYYAGKVKCIYIDPPYNTGAEHWTYNDNVNSPEIRQWLGRTVGDELVDLSRHDKWLCMMYPRLALLRNFLRDDGVIFVSIDDTEVGHCRMLMDEIFQARNFVANLVWHKRVSPANDAKLFSSDHDHILVYARERSRWRPNRLAHNEEQRKYYNNPDNDPRGPWNSAAYTCAKTADERPNLYYPVTNPNTGDEVWPSRKRVWAYDKAAHARNVANDLLWWGKNGLATKPRIKKFLEGARPVVPRSIWGHKEAGHNQEAKLEVLKLLSDEVHFVTPKPIRLLKRIIEVASDSDSLVLDSFAGSGTTAHAVLAQNKADGGNRRFITVEMDAAICRDVTAQRIRKAIEGYGETPGLGGGFRFCKLGAGLFDEAGNIAGEVKFSDLAAHVFFTETGSPIPQRAKADCPLLGIHNGTAVYLLFNGVLGDRRPAGGNVLTHAVAQGLPEHPQQGGPRVVYGEACRLGPKSLAQYGITFRQVPFELKVG